ncbi:hypothetical protein SprV_0902696800 [Sparganum proliferum]
MFAVRQLQEKCQDMRNLLNSNFVNLTKPFEKMNREGLWKVMQEFGCPERFIQMMRLLHDGMMARVTDNGAVSEAFAVTNGVKQGCVLAPTLFSLMFSVILMDAYRDERPGIRIAYRTDGQLLNHRWMHFQSHVSTTTVHELLFADDWPSTPHRERTCKGAWISSTPPARSSVCVNRTQPQVVDSLTYLDSTLSRTTNIDDEVARRISKASQAFSRPASPRSPPQHQTEDLQGGHPAETSIWTETWTVYEKQARMLNHYHLSCLRRILKLRWQDLILKTEVLERTGIPSMYAMLRQLQLRWSGHLVQMDDERLPK